MLNTKIKYYSFFIILILAVPESKASAQIQLGGLPQYITHNSSSKTFTIAAQGKTAEIIVDPDDWKGEIRAGIHTEGFYG